MRESEKKKMERTHKRRGSKKAHSRSGSKRSDSGAAGSPPNPSSNTGASSQMVLRVTRNRGPSAVDELLTGDRVRLTDGRSGTIRYVGCVHFANGTLYGIELMEGMGQHSGTVDGTKYFDVCSLSLIPSHSLLSLTLSHTLTLLFPLSSPPFPPLSSAHT